MKVYKNNLAKLAEKKRDVSLRQERKRSIPLSVSSEVVPLSLESLFLLELFRGEMIFHCILLLFWILPTMTCEKFEETDERGIIANVADVIESLNSKDVFKCEKHSKPIDCKEVLENGNTESGVYTI
ncbi:hypothetical protein TNCT_5161, partial [Trichonephila clavata]